MKKTPADRKGELRSAILTMVARDLGVDLNEIPVCVGMITYITVPLLYAEELKLEREFRSILPT